MQDPSHVCDLHWSSWQCWILNSLGKARDWTHILMDTSRVCYRWATMGTPINVLNIIIYNIQQSQGKVWYIHTVECLFFSHKEEEVLIHGRAWMNLENCAESKSQTQGVPAVVQQVKDLVWSQLQLRFSPLPGSFHMMQRQRGGKKKKKGQTQNLYEAVQKGSSPEGAGGLAWGCS